MTNLTAVEQVNYLTGMNEPNWSQYIGEVIALQALEAGEATKEQQKTALKFISEVLGGLHKPSFFGENTHVSAFNEGRRYVPWLLSAAAKQNVERLEAEAVKQRDRAAKQRSKS